MRFFEILFIGLLSIQFLIPLIGILKNSPFKKWFWLLPSLTLLVHLFDEGYRWQMIPAYSALFILLISQFVTNPEKKFWSIFNNTTIIVLLILSMFLATALPVLNFSSEGGVYKVGVRNYQLLDNNREEILTENTDDFREVSVRVFYPTDEQGSHSYPYFPEFETVKHTYQKKLGWPYFFLNYLKLSSVEAKENARVPEQEFPVVFYSHGLTNNYGEASGRLMKLASHGYIVIAINHTYSSDFGILSDESVVGYKALSRYGDPIEKIDSVKTVIAHQWLNDLVFVKDTLSNSELTRSLDLSRIGILGFSAGGTMAVLGSYELENIKAVINLDGTPRGINPDTPPNSPVLFMYSEPENFSDAQIKAWGITREEIEAPVKLIQERSKRILSNASAGSELIDIPDTRHSNFTEYALVSPLNSYLGIGGKADAIDTYDRINDEILNFFNQYLKNQE